MGARPYHLGLAREPKPKLTLTPYFSPSPTRKLVDLVWHTHMQADDPQQYRRDCLTLAGRFVDHNDDV